MTSEKKPSIYVDRGTIGSSDELDEYGVWVKSEPQDLSSANLRIHDTQDLSEELSEANESDLDFPEISDLPDFDAHQAESSAAVSEIADTNDDFEVPDIELEEKSDSEEYELGDFADSNVTLEDSDDFMEIPEIDDTADNIRDNIRDSIQDDIQENIQEEKAEESGDNGFTEVSMDDFIGSLDSEPEDFVHEEEIVAVVEEKPAETIPTVNSAAQTAASGTPAVDLSTQLLIKIAEELSSIRLELSDLKKEFSGIKTSSQPEEEGENDFFGEEDDEKIALTGDELNNILNTADFTEEAGSDATVEISEELVIEEEEETESSDIFFELDTEPADTELADTELADTDSAQAEPEIVEAEQIPEVILSEESQEETGLDSLKDLDLDLSLGDSDFEELSNDAEPEADQIPQPEEEETDETVSAEFEDMGTGPFEIESAGPYQIEETEDFNVSLDDEGFDLGEITADVRSMRSVNLSSEESQSVDLQTGEDIVPEFTDGESEELRQLRENGAEPMSFAPDQEDTEYLEHDPLAGESLDEESRSGGSDAGDFSLTELGTAISDETIDLSDAVIDEPDLSLDIQDNPLEEPSLEDISINLDLSDLGSEEPKSIEVPVEAEPVEEENIFGEEQSLQSLIPEAFAGEAEDIETPVEGIEEETISGVDLDTLDETAPAVPMATEQFHDVEETKAAGSIPTNLQRELKTVLSYLDQLLESLPDEKIEEFARSDYYDTYKKLFRDLGLV